MKLKKEYIALAVVVVALLLYIFMKNTDKTHYSLPVLDKIDKSDITKLVITRPSGTMTLERYDDQWKIQPQGYPADQNQVDKMLDAVDGFALTTLVSESGNYIQYELTDEKKICLEVFGGDEMLGKFDIGKTASTYRHTFVRLEGDNRVYQARNNIRQPFEIEVDRLRDKVVSKIDKDFVTNIDLAGADGDLKIIKREEPPVPFSGGEGDSVEVAQQPLWQTQDGKEANEKIIEGILGAIANLRCDKYIEGRTKEDFQNPVFTITVEGSSTIKLDIFEKQEDNKYPAVSSQNDYPFLLPEWSVNRIMKKPDEILVKSDVENSTGSTSP